MIFLLNVPSVAELITLLKESSNEINVPNYNIDHEHICKIGYLITQSFAMHKDVETLISNANQMLIEK